MNLINHIKYKSLNEIRPNFSFGIIRADFNIIYDTILERKSTIKINMYRKSADYYHQKGQQFYFNNLNDILDWYINESLTFLIEKEDKEINQKSLLFKILNKSKNKLLKKEIEEKKSFLNNLLDKDSQENIKNRFIFFNNIFSNYFYYGSIDKDLSNSSIKMKVLDPFHIGEEIYLFNLDKQELIKTIIVNQQLISNFVTYYQTTFNFQFNDYYAYHLLFDNNGEKTIFQLYFSNTENEYKIFGKEKYLFSKNLEDFKNFQKTNQEKKEVIELLTFENFKSVLINF